MSEGCTCDYVEVNGTRLMMRVYDERCPTHGPQDEAEVEKVPDPWSNDVDFGLVW